MSAESCHISCSFWSYPWLLIILARCNPWKAIRTGRFVLFVHSPALIGESPLFDIRIPSDIFFSNARVRFWLIVWCCRCGLAAELSSNASNFLAINWNGYCLWIPIPNRHTIVAGVVSPMHGTYKEIQLFPIHLIAWPSRKMIGTRRFPSLAEQLLPVYTASASWTKKPDCIREFSASHLSPYLSSIRSSLCRPSVPEFIFAK